MPQLRSKRMKRAESLYPNAPSRAPELSQSGNIVV